MLRKIFDYTGKLRETCLWNDNVRIYWSNILFYRNRFKKFLWRYLKSRFICIFYLTYSAIVKFKLFDFQNKYRKTIKPICHRSLTNDAWDSYSFLRRIFRCFIALYVRMGLNRMEPTVNALEACKATHVGTHIGSLRPNDWH